MKKKNVAFVVMLTALLVMAMASTAFAATQQVYSRVQIEIKLVGNNYSPYNNNTANTGNIQCGASAKQEPAAPENNTPAASGNEQPAAPETHEPAVNETEEPVVPENNEPQTNEQPVADDQNNTEPAGQPEQNLSELSAQEREMVQYVNDERVKAGLKPLQVDVELAKVARIKSQDMVDNGYFAHNSPTYGSPFDMMKNFGIQYRAAGENIAKNGSVIGAHQSLMNSEGHRANILNPNFTHIGIGIVSNGNMGGITVTQMFIAK